MKLCLCGSTRYKDEYARLNKELTLAGHIVITVATFDRPGELLESGAVTAGLSYEDKTVLDLVHLKKILDADAVVLVGKKEDGAPYLGQSTSRELMWALINGKQVFWHDQDIHHLIKHQASARASYDACMSAWGYGEG